MKCSNCQTEMEKGLLGSMGTRWQKGVGMNPKLLEGISGPLVIAYRCPKCKKVELVTE